MFHRNYFCLSFGSMLCYCCNHSCMLTITLMLFIQNWNVFFQILCRFYVGRKAMFDSDFKGGILAELSITFVNF